ncbi:fibronectin type III domain-containing protein [Streptomyces sp. NPDC051315]|uniref:fibronectin type III domain-containing protein n=1 Tax=Streptomyces sp. NPDC051315 TaxID=3365650 RepID=UPI0037A4E78E
MKPARLSTAVVLATTGGLLTTVTVAATPASAAASCVSPVYQRQMFANTTFSGGPKRTDCDSAIDQNWGTGAPAAGLPSNHFGVRWTVTRDFGSGGPFALTASSQDGIRVYVDGVRRIDLWRNVSATVSRTLNLTVPAGKHTLRIDYVNWTGRADVKFAYAPRTSATVDKVRPLAPTEVGVGYYPDTNRAKYTWAKNKEMDLAGYRVYRRLAGSSTWTKLTTTTSNTYTDSPPADGRTYYYEIRAYDKAGNVSPGSADRGIISVDRVAPTAPTGVTATSTKTANTLFWAPVPTAVKYEVARAETVDGPYTSIVHVPSTSYADAFAPADVPVFYKVRALDAAANPSPYSKAVTATRDTVAPGAPQDLKVVAQDVGGVTLTWLNGGSDATGYVVYRSATTTGGQTRIGTTGTLTYRDTTGEPGRPYTYHVAAVDAAGNESAAQATTATRTVDQNSAPATPTWNTARIVGDQLVLDWAQDGYVEVGGYLVYRSRSATVDTSETAMPYASVDGPLSQYQATVPATERDYYYAVVATSAGHGVRSAASSAVLPSVSATPPPQPTQVDQVTAGDGRVTLTWGTAPDLPGESRITGYRVHRSTTPGVTRENAEAVLSTTASDLTDTGLTNGTTYYYAVTTVNAAGLESTLSSEVSATPTAP